MIWLKLYLIGLVVMVLLTSFMAGFMDESPDQPDIFTLLIIVILWPITIPAILAYLLGAYVDEKRKH